MTQMDYFHGTFLQSLQKKGTLIAWGKIGLNVLQNISFTYLLG